MHDCWKIPEIALAITEACAPHFKEPLPTTSIRFDGSLASLSRTCRALQGPALDVLWYYQFGLLHLLQCLPQELWEVHEVHENVGDETHVRRSEDRVYKQWVRIALYDDISPTHSL